MTVTTGLQPQQQLEAYAQATADATGAAQFKFPFVPQSLTWVGNVTVLGAPYSSLLVATVGTTPWGVWTGPLPFGPIMAPQRTQLVITATGLQPGINYSASWLGISDLADQIGPVMPAPASAIAATFPVAPVLLQLNFQPGLTWTSPQFQCSNVAGARYVIQNNDTVNALVIQLRWQPTSGPITTAQVNQLPVFSTGSTFRNIVIPPSGFANFTHPHLADYLTVTANSPTGTTQLKFNIVVAHVASNKIAWSGIIHDTIPDSLFHFNGSLPVGASIPAVTVDVYAGPATFGVTVPAASNWAASIDAQGTDGVFATIARMNNLTHSTSGGTLQLTLPAAGVRCSFANNDAAAKTVTLALLVDDWRD